MTQIGKNIKKIRNVKGLSQQAFADIFGLTRGNISSYEESRAEPKIEVIIKVAKYFSIPLIDFIEKDLSVNELLHYNTNLVIETEKLKTARRLANIPYVSTPYISDYTQNYKDANFIQKLPVITVPYSSKSELIAIEIQDINELPAGFEYKNGDIMIFEKVTKENIHHTTGKLGMMTSEITGGGNKVINGNTADDDSNKVISAPKSLKFGIYNAESNNNTLSLNDLVKYPFDINSGRDYWLLQASYKQE